MQGLVGEGTVHHFSLLITTGGGGGSGGLGALDGGS